MLTLNNLSSPSGPTKRRSESAVDKVRAGALKQEKANKGKKQEVVAE